jgi:hypothetical protein
MKRDCFGENNNAYHRLPAKIKRDKPLKRRLKSLKQIKKDSWEVFTEFIKLRDRHICFTCGRYCEGKNCHGGHFIKKSIGGLVLYFNEKNVHVQCYNCNITLDGNQYEYGVRLGPKIVKELYDLKLKTKGTVWDRFDYEAKIAEYKIKVQNLNEKN